jgi:hypothetical protein
MRGGTALYKLHLKPAARYSEDIDLVQTRAEAAGPTMEALREILDPWLGKPQWKQTEGRVTFVYRFNSEDTPPIPLRLKVEINTREHFVVYGFKQIPFQVSSRWFGGAAISTATNSTSFSEPSCGRCISASRGGTCSTWRPGWKNRRSHLTVSSRRFWST